MMQHRYHLQYLWGISYDISRGPIPRLFMMTSSKGNIFRVTGHLCGDFNGPRLIPHTKASDAASDVYFDLRPNKRLSKQSWGWSFGTPSRPFWRHRNVIAFHTFLLCVITLSCGVLFGLALCTSFIHGPYMLKNENVWLRIRHCSYWWPGALYQFHSEIFQS